MPVTYLKKFNFLYIQSLFYDFIAVQLIGVQQKCFILCIKCVLKLSILQNIFLLQLLKPHLLSVR